MVDNFGTRIAARACTNVGVAFRLHGRSSETGFDCVGLLADALNCVGFEVDVPAGYSLRGRFDDHALGFFDRAEFVKIQASELPNNGDLALVKVSARQLHFIIFVSTGFVHAHAGLRRIVLTPGHPPWPVIGHWRYIGE